MDDQKKINYQMGMSPAVRRTVTRLRKKRGMSTDSAYIMWRIALDPEYSKVLREELAAEKDKSNG